MTWLKYIAKQIIFPIFQASVIIDLSSDYLSSNFSCWNQRRPCHIPIKKVMYRNYPKFLDRQIWANSVDPDQTAEQQSDQGLHCLPFHLHLFDALLCGKDTLFNFYDNYCYFFFFFRVFKYGPRHVKTCFCHMQTTKAQISLRICAV